MRWNGRLVAAGAAVALLVGLSACGSSGPSEGHVAALSSDAPVVEPSPTPSPTPSPKPKPTKTAKARPAAPPTIEVPEPPGCAGFTGKNISKSAVASLLTKAQQVQYWKGLDQEAVDPVMWPVPTIKVPLSLLKAIAYMESGWRTACKANDGIGFGLFQISAGTQDQMNLRFGQSFDRMTAAGNAGIAVSYLEWTIAKLGIAAFGKQYDVTKNTKLLNAVIASFNFGPDAVLVGGQIVIPNPDYVDSVRAMMGKACPCQQW